MHTFWRKKKYPTYVLLGFHFVVNHVYCDTWYIIQSEHFLLEGVWRSFIMSFAFQWTEHFKCTCNANASPIVGNVSFTATGTIPYIPQWQCCPGWDAWNWWKEIQATRTYLIVGMHRSSLRYKFYDYMHVWYRFYLQLYFFILYVLYFVRDDE